MNNWHMSSSFLPALCKLMFCLVVLTVFIGFVTLAVIVKGSSMSKYYRFLGKVGEWVWMRTKATIIYNTSGVAQYVVAMNYVIG